MSLVTSLLVSHALPLSSPAVDSAVCSVNSAVRTHNTPTVDSLSDVRVAIVEIMMGKKDPPSKISLRSSLFPNVPPYIHFTSVVLKDALPTVSPAIVTQ